ncbi:MAG: SpoIIE family protein phosphatase, partial [Bacteroidales bacterium]|nr:SpoIIE family protein phosphatase [Bacteroidales bacterium]
MKKILFHIGLMLLVVTGMAQTYNIKQYTVQDGLLHSFVNDIIQDKRGNIWVATGGGLSKFNGVNFTNYTKKDGLNSYRLLSLSEDDFGNIWIGSQNGLNVFNGDSIYSLVSSAKTIYALEKSVDGKMWVASNAGIQKVSFENGIFNVKDLNYDFGYSDVSNIFQDRNRNSFLIETSKNRLFIGLNNKIFTCFNESLKKIKTPNNIQIFSACKLPGDKVFFGTNKGLYTLNGDSLTPFFSKFLVGFKVLKLKYHNLKLWMIGTWDNQDKDKLFLASISLSDMDYFRKISASNGLIDNPTSLFIDYEKNVWIGSNGGLSVLKNKAFITYTTKDGLAGDKIWSLLRDSNDNIWVGTIGQGLSVITKNGILKFDLSSGLPDLYVGSIFQLSENKFLLGTAHKGLCLAQFIPAHNTCHFQQLDIRLNQGETRVDAIVKDRYGILWVGSNKGLFYSNDNGKEFSFFPLEKGKTQIFIQKILETQDGRLLIGTRQQGLFSILPSGKVEHLLGKNEKIGVSSICEDKNHQIWISSLNKGILRMGGKNRWLNENDGLKSNLIYILQLDKNGNLWIGSNLGLDCLNTVEYNKTGRINIRHYNSNDGLLALEMNLNGSLEDTYGNLWFASNNGLVKYDYHYDIVGRIPPIINLLKVKLYSTEVDWHKYADSLISWNNLPVNPVLPYNKNHISFEFVGISFKNPKEIKYAWKLEGFDKNWMPPTYTRQAVYSNLPSGKYVFLLKSSNSDGVWNINPLKFSFTIQPPFWVQWWFIILAIIFSIVLIFSLVKLRTHSLLKRQRELELQIKLRTEKILLQKEELESQIEIVSKQKQEIEVIHHQISDSIEYAKRIQDAALPVQENLQSFVDDAFVFFKQRDVVSGDFYWWTPMKLDNVLVVTVADCTGHGVPGAFMSLLGISFLREIVTKEYVTHPGVILRKLRKEIINSLKQKDDFGGQKDGMDMSLVSLNLDTMELQFAGANNPLYIITNDELQITNNSSIKAVVLNEEKQSEKSSSKLLYEIKPDKIPIAIYGRMDKFTNHHIQLKKGDQIYLFSDGFADQFGGTNNKKFKYKPFKRLLLENADKPMKEQKDILESIFTKWKGNNEQVDDVT